MRYDVAGLGNAIMDVLVRIPDDGVLATLGLTRGLMHPVDHERWMDVYHAVQEHGAEIRTGGSCANTISTLGFAGRKVRFCGQLGHDQFGALYASQITEACGGHDLHVAQGQNTGKCISLISARDAERTMCTHLGAAVELPHIGDFEESIRQSRVLHVTGYLFLGGQMADAARQAIGVARDAGVPISLDVADPFVVRTVRDEMWRVARDYASIVFLNAEEAHALTGESPADAVHTIASHVKTVVVKQGSRGSLVKQGGRVHEVGVVPVDAVDTTGAGDNYAAGFLYGVIAGWPADKCGELGSRFASLCVGQVGAVVRDRAALLHAIREVERSLP